MQVVQDGGVAASEGGAAVGDAGHVQAVQAGREQHVHVELLAVMVQPVQQVDPVHVTCGPAADRRVSRQQRPGRHDPLRRGPTGARREVETPRRPFPP